MEPQNQPTPKDARYPKPPFPEQSQPKPGIERKMQPRPQFRGELYRAAGKLAGKKALITGGDSGIGRAVAVLYAKEGADVAIVYLPAEEDDAIETRAAVEGEGRRCLLIPGDVTDSQFCTAAVQQTVNELGSIDILVNNAAFQQSCEHIEEITDEQIDKTFRTNIYSFFYLARAAVKHMPPGSAIVNCGSVAGLRGSKDLLDYASTKGAIDTFTRSLAVHLAERQIRVNCVAPGPVWTPLNVVDADREATKHGEKTQFGRPAQPEEIAPAFVFFASGADSNYVSGEILALQGGEIVS